MTRRLCALVSMLAICSGVAACTFNPTIKSASGGNGGTQTGQGGASGASATGGAGGTTVPPTCNPCTDFPTTPVLDMPTGGMAPPSNAADLFGPAGSGSSSGGPCLIEPEAESLFPRNWLRPRFRFQAGTGQDLFEIRLHTDAEVNDLVVYTTASTWTMPKDMWTALASHATDRDIAITVRGTAAAGGAMPSMGTSTTMRIAPVDAPGTIVYWTTSGGSALKGFSVGDENVVTVLTPANTPGKCVGCHSSTPDGSFIGFSNSTSTSNGDPSHIEIRSGQNPANEPSFLSASGKTLLARVSQELPTFSKAHWQSGDHVVAFMHADSTSASGQATHLLWIDLEATSTDQGTGWGELARTGDPNGAVANPFFSHDGNSIVYTSAPTANPSGILQHGDIYTVAYGNRQGGAAMPVAGAATTAFSEFYPAFSPDDRWIAYTRLPDGQGSYNNASSEVFIIPASGGTATRIGANDPGTCLAKTSPGITNSWPKWAPEAQFSGGKIYYWLIFSSKRNEAGNPQLYVAGVVTDETGNLSTTPALYLWNQPAAENNHTPAWDVFQIPPVP